LLFAKTTQFYIDRIPGILWFISTKTAKPPRPPLVVLMVFSLQGMIKITSGGLGGLAVLVENRRSLS